MLVASGVEFGDDGKAAVTPLPEVIGNIRTVIGCGIVTHPDGTAVQVMVGDPVCQGDAIETGPGGQIEIRFIDGTVFNLSGDSRVVLREFVCDSDRTDSALLAVTKGTFAFIAGRVASAGSLWVDTPVGSIRGRSRASGFGMLSLAALVFSFVKAHAADPDVTFLDDDRITYKDFEHGVFELVTKEATPRHIIVDDPGETIVLTKRGSSVGVNQLANSAARMEELQAAQQDLLANLTTNVHGPNGSSTPPFVNPQELLQPINFTQPDPTHPQNSLSPLDFPVITVPEIIIVRPPTLQITGVGGQIGVAADNVINAARANAGVDITGTTSGVEDGRIVSVTLVDGTNHVVYSGTATVTNGSWSINLDPAEARALADGIDTLTAVVSNSAGGSAQASQAIRVDETPPTIAINTVVSNDIVNAKVASAGFVVAGTTTDAENGQPVTVKIVDSSGHVVETFTTTLANNAWSINVTSAEAKLLHDGTYTVTADVSDSAGNPAPEAAQAITVDETPPTVTWSPRAESGIEGAAIALGAITATVNSVPGHSNSVQSLVVSGIPVGAVLTDGTNNFTATGGDTSIDVKSWDLSDLKITPPNDTNFTLTVTATDQDANTASASELVTVVPLAPALSPVAAQGNEDTAIALDLGAMARSLSGANGDVSPNSLATLVVSDVPAGATLSDGTGLPGHSFTATAGDSSFDVAGWDLSSVRITPPVGFEGSFTLTIAATERDSEGDISSTVTATEVVTVAPVAEPPTARAPETLTLNENATGVAVAGLSVGPPAEDSDDTVSATLRVSHGTLHVASLSGVTVTGDDCATLTLSGSAADVNSLLAGLTYTPTHEYEGSDTLRLSVTSSDGSNINRTTAATSTVITVNPVAEVPAATAPATLTLNENATGVTVAGVSVGPPAEDNDDTVSVTLAVSQGTLHVASLSGVTVAGDDSATLTLSGDAAAVNSLLAGLTYTPTHEYEGSDTLHLSVTSSDGTNVNSTTATASTAITVNPVAGTPTATTPATLTLNENATGVAIAGVSVGPLAEDNDDTVSATLAVSQGTLHVGSVSGVTVSGDDSATLTLSGSAAAVNSLLAGLTYTPTAEYEGSDTLHLSVTSSDGTDVNSTTATASTAITVKPIAEAPTATAPPTLTFGEDDDIVAIVGVSVGPLAEDSDDTVSATLTVSHGTLHVGILSGVTVSGDDSGTLTLSGSAAAVNKLLAGLIYMPFEEEGPDTLHLSVTSSDGSNTYPTEATATTALKVEVDSESLIVGGPGPMLDWNDAANWSAGVVPTLGIDVTINAPSNYTAIITGTPVAQAETLTIPHGAATTEIAVGGTLQLAGDLNVSFSGKLENDGTLEEMANATFIGPVTNNGTIIVDPNVDLDVNGTITGIGKFWIDIGTTLEFDLGSKVAPGTTDSQTIYFEQGAGKLIIDDWGKFAGVITGTAIGTQLTTNDLIDLTQLPFVGGSMSASVSYNSGTNISTVTFSDGNSANNVTLHLSGNYTGAAWTFASINGGSGTEISDPPAASGAVTSGATGQIAAANTAAMDFASASLVPGNSQDFTKPVAGFAGDGTASTLSASQAFTSTLTKSGVGYGALPMIASAVWASTPDTSSAAAAPNIGDALADMIMGGFGAVLLTGANGKEAFGNSSDAVQFASGSDKIDLTAFGAHDFETLALTPTSTSVPAHTIAWLVHSATNETIVYVNPTDQPLDIRDSGLAEIHLQGVSSVQSSDFLLAPAAHVMADGASIDPAAATAFDATIAAMTNTDVLSTAIAGEGALPTDGGSTTHTTTAKATHVGFETDAAPDKFAWIEARTDSIEQTASDTVITVPSGHSVDLPHITLMELTETGFAFDHKPLSSSADAAPVGHDAVMHGLAPQSENWILPPDGGSNVDSGTGPGGDEDHGASSQKNLDSPNADVDSNPGGLKASENSDGNHSTPDEAGEHGAPHMRGADVDDVEPSSIDGDSNPAFHLGYLKRSENDLGSHSISSEASEHGTSPFHGADAHGVGPSSIDVDPNPGGLKASENGIGNHSTPREADKHGATAVDMLGLGDSFHFKHETSGSGDSGDTDQAAPDHVPGSASHHDDAAGTHGHPAAGPHMLDLPPPVSTDDLAIVPDHGKGHDVTHVQHDLIV